MGEIADVPRPAVSALSSGELEAWLAIRAECLDLRARQRDEERVIEQADAEARDLRDRIDSALRVAGGDGPAQASFADLLALAEAVVERDAQLTGLRTQLTDRRATLAKRDRELAKSRAADAEWTRSWAQTCTACWLGESGVVPPLATVREMVTALSELGPWLEKRAALASRIGKMEDDQASFVQEAGHLVEELGLEGPPASPIDRAAALTQRLAAVRGLEARRAELSARMVEAETKRRTLAQERAVLTERSAAMTAFFGAVSLDAVDDCLDRVRQRIDLTASADEIEHEIVVTLASPSLAEAETALSTADPSALETEQADLKARLLDLDARTHTLYAEHTRADDALRSVGGDDAVARIAERRRTVLLETEDKALRYLRLRIGIAAAEQALRAYRDQHRSSMMTRASEAFRTISRGAYSGLTSQPGEKGEVLVAVGGGLSKDASQLSKGTRFQLYLALRVAGYYEYCLSREPVPFVADDIMETFDDFRAEEAFRLFADMAQVGQVVYLTHHRHLCDIARSVCPDVRITELPVAA